MVNGSGKVICMWFKFIKGIRLFAFQLLNGKLLNELFVYFAWFFFFNGFVTSLNISVLYQQENSCSLLFQKSMVC